MAVTFAAAMYDDPMIRWPLPPDVSLKTVEQATRPIAAMYVEVGAGWLLDDGWAMAAWIDPAAAARFDELELPTRAAIAPHTDDGGARYGRFWDWLATHIPDEPCWFLDLVAVHPSRQGRGLGARLVRHGLQLAASDGLPAFLETGQQRNVAMYERFGFRVVGAEPAPDGGPTIWFMSTEPQRA
jgi:GNAT superfamily N-acetyltransferase